MRPDEHEARWTFYLHCDSQKKKPRLGGAGATLGPGGCGARICEKENPPHHIQDYLGRAVAGGAVVDA